MNRELFKNLFLTIPISSVSCVCLDVFSERKENGYSGHQCEVSLRRDAEDLAISHPTITMNDRANFARRQIRRDAR